jgi:hypothetical protein
MTKIRLNNTHRDVLSSYGQERIESLIDRKEEKELYAILLDGANEAIRAKYPEEHMVILRLYDCARKDQCLQFQFPSGKVDGFYFKAEDNLQDLPSRGGCYSSGNVAYPVHAAFETAYDQYHVVKKANDQGRDARVRSFNALVNAARTLEDVLEAIDLPQELQERLGKKSQALVALNDDTLKALKRDFALDVRTESERAAA